MSSNVCNGRLCKYYAKNRSGCHKTVYSYITIPNESLCVDNFPETKYRQSYGSHSCKLCLFYTSGDVTIKIFQKMFIVDQINKW